MSTENQSLSSGVSTVKSTKPAEYVVVARRYRPQSFDDLVGQNSIATALSNAIRSNRIGHAYLFTGARGVGKTSTARILAKSLNCIHGPTPTPCNVCDICMSIAAGSDVDVIEIDGASNRGIDEIRQLRQNVTIRPSRSRFKIYIIDEVHMLTREAFNALLKTLEEPPEHVKFIFCTTEPGKIPITILSRCQRFDFSGIEQDSITRRLQFIVQSEGVEAESAALEVLARRAAGSMRDSQSLLEQLLAFAPDRKITVADVQQMLGIVGEEPLLELLDLMAAGNIAAAVTYFDAAMLDGVEPGTLLEQLLGVLRDAMVAAAGAPQTACIYVSPANRDRLGNFANRWRLDTICAAMQMIDQTLGRMRYSTQGRILAELLLVRLCKLENLGDLAAVLGRLAKGEFPDGPIVVSQTISLVHTPEASQPIVPQLSSQIDAALSMASVESVATQASVMEPAAKSTKPQAGNTVPQAGQSGGIQLDELAPSTVESNTVGTDAMVSAIGESSAVVPDRGGSRPPVAESDDAAGVSVTKRSPPSVRRTSLDDVNAAMTAATADEIPLEQSATTERHAAMATNETTKENKETTVPTTTTDPESTTISTKKVIRKPSASKVTETSAAEETGTESPAASISQAEKSPHSTSTATEAASPKRATRRRATGNMSEKRREALDHPLLQQARTLFGMELDVVEQTPGETSE
ncbi:MAG: DNA polymerase III subunit gamma/tau [Thermoguttaceae bacterium]|nr:DNA polymerase III subunit gamma/tau [Thermoguttaceae bacterium]